MAPQPVGIIQNGLRNGAPPRLAWRAGIQPASRRASIRAAIVLRSSSLIAARGLPTWISPTTCAGRGERTKIRSARAIASSTSWVTSTVIMLRLSTSFARSPCNCRASGASSETNGSSSSSRVRANGERARQRCPSRQADRELAGKVCAVLGKAERREQSGELGFTRVGRDEPHIVFDAAPRQKPRLLENHAHSAMLGHVD